DYYRFRAFFEPYQIRTDQVPGEVDFEKDGIPRVFDCNLDAPTYRFVRGDEKHPDTDKPLLPGLPRLLALNDLKIEPVALPAEAHMTGLRPFVLDDHLRAAEREITAARQALEQAGKGPAQVSGPPTEQEQAALALAEKALAAAEARPAALRARAAADRARHQQPAPENVQELARQAAHAEPQLA